tara:strand:+ start:368 stop:523 length:156 start_codon:yes stop_codon:yes gene_type:complete
MIKTLLEGLEFCKEHKIYDKNIIIALGKNKVPMTIKEGLEQLRFKTCNKKY